MINPDRLTPPEHYAERLRAKRLRAQMNADRRQYGNCCICRWRDTTFGVLHCKGYPERQQGICEEDTKLPKFSFDDTILEKYE